MVFRRQTLFIVGAGASAELGLPVGSQLAQQIAKSALLAFDDLGKPKSRETAQLITYLVKRSPSEAAMNSWLEALLQIAQGIHLKRSIDSYIDQHADQPSIADMGKLLIAIRIIAAERESHIAVSEHAPVPNLRRKDVESSWLDQFAAMLFEGLRATDLDQLGDNLDIVCFNYDRCIEHYLTHALAVTYSIPAERAASLVARLNIIHPYGSLGPLATIPYGSTHSDIWSISRNLKTFSESAASEIEMRIENAVRRAERFVYLGFSFGRQNMELLSTQPTPSDLQEGRPSYASGFGLFQQATTELTRQIEGIYGYSGYAREPSEFTSIEVGVTARGLIDMHWHNIMAS